MPPQKKILSKRILLRKDTYNMIQNFLVDFLYHKIGHNDTIAQVLEVVLEKLPKLHRYFTFARRVFSSVSQVSHVSHVTKIE